MRKVVESPRPHTLDTIAALCMSLMAGSPSKEQWKSRFFDLKERTLPAVCGQPAFGVFRLHCCFLTRQHRPPLPSGRGHPLCCPLSLGHPREGVRWLGPTTLMTLSLLPRPMKWPQWQEESNLSSRLKIIYSP